MFGALRRNGIPLAVCWLVVMNPGWVLGQRSTPANLEKLVKQAGMIFAGRVIDVETGTKDRMNLYMTAYTFQVLDKVFGVEKDTLTVKQYGGEANGRKFYPAGIPRFEKGEEVLVFLYPLSLIGMTSSVGRDQGKFWIQRGDSSSASTLINKLNNKGLFKGLNHPELLSDPQWQKREPVALAYKPFLKTIRDLVAKLKEKTPRHR